MNPLFTVIHEDDNLLVVHKPADLVCHPTKGDEYSSLISRARLYLHRSLGEGGSDIGHQPSAILHPASISVDQRFPSSPHLIHRLDRETSGLVVIAKNRETARDLGRLWETREVRKEYLAIVHGHVLAEQGTIDAPLGKDLTSRVAIKDCVRPDGSPAQTEFHVLNRFTRSIGESPHFLHPASCNLHPESALDHQPTLEVDNDKVNRNREPSTILNPAPCIVDHPFHPFTLLRVMPHSGRKHQIRIHLSHIGHRIVGDKIYGGDEDAYLALVEGRLTTEHRRRLILPHHALHATRITFNWRGKTWDFSTAPEPWFQAFLDFEAGPRISW